MCKNKTGRAISVIILYSEDESEDIFMKIAVLHGQSRKGSTWHITKQLLDSLCNGAPCEVEEFWFKDNTACVGCFSCFANGEDTCPHYGQNSAVMHALEGADVIIAESPNYCMGMAGQLKIFMDHMAYRWMSHRPYPAMFRKVGVVVSTTAGAGASQVTKELKRQLFYWGVAKTYQLPMTVSAMGWKDVSEKTRAKITRRVQKLSAKVLYSAGHAKPGFKTKFIFGMMRGMQSGNSWMPRDRAHWEQNGWLNNARPWK